MILVDANLLVYAHVKMLPQHSAAHTWLDQQINATARVAMPWPSLLAFVRLVSNPRIFQPAEPISEAWKQVEDWLGCENIWIPQPGERHTEVLGKLLRDIGINSELVPDAHLAALAIEHGLELCSTDGDFGRFSGLKWSNPLKANL